MTGVLGFALVAAACGGSDDSSSSGETASTVTTVTEDQRSTGGKLVYATTISPTGMDPVQSGGSQNPNADAVYFSAVYDMLAYVDNETGQVVPKTAESLETTDGKVWTIKIREGINFTDGTPYDAAAVKLNWERIADPANASPNAGVAQKIESMEIVDPLTLSVTLKAADTQFHRNIANHIPFVASPAAIEAGTVSEQPVGAGPFTMASWTRDNEMVFEKNPDYWVEGRPYLDELSIRLIENSSQRYNALTTGELDVAYVHSFYQMVSQAESAGFTVDRVTVPGGFTLMFNTAKPPFDDPVARQAVATAIDRVNLDATLSFGALPPAETIYNEDHPFYVADAKLHSYDEEKAQELFDQYAETHGGPLTFTVNSADNQLPVMEFIQAGLAKFENVKMEIEVTVPLQSVERALAGDFQATIFTMNWADPEPDVTNFLSTDGGRNYMKYSNPEVDAAIQAGRSSLDTEERAKAYEIVQKAIVEDAPFTFFRPLAFLTVLGNDVENFETYNAGIPNWAELSVKSGS
jgi:peptide/nickel transport system substrate-binding protein